MPLPKGRTNNPHGRPRKNSTLTEALRDYVMSKKKLALPGFTDDTARDALVKKLYKMALMESDLAAIKYIFDRLDGKPTETVRAMVESGALPVIKSLQKELFDFEGEECGERGAGYLEPPEEAGGSAEEQLL
ncbi:MAG: DUF5681 domain-containing protein [Treponema sp.]|jgi:hypothetical protein|nr:DUF5681 domain-containing protein [Treponema sp.]